MIPKERINEFRLLLRSVSENNKINVEAVWDESTCSSNLSGGISYRLILLLGKNNLLQIGELIMQLPENTVIVASGSVFLRISGRSHKFQGVSFSLLNPQSQQNHNAQFPLAIHAPTAKMPHYLELLTRIKSYFKLRNFPLENGLCGSLLHVLLGDFYTEVKHPWEQVYKTEAVGKVCALIAANPERNYSLDSLAKHAHLSKFHFLRLFKENTGCSPHQYQILQRCQTAFRLLSEGTCSITEVAEKLNYPNVYSFSRQFKKVFLFPPSKSKQMKGKLH